MREGGSSAAVLIAAAALSAGPRIVRTPPPAQVPAALRAAVAPQCVALDLEAPGGGTLRVWPARRIRAAAPEHGGSPYLRERIQYAIEPGSLVAVASWDAPWRDYRDQPIAAGVYALLYAVQPAIKEHRGVSEFRDVLLVVPARDAAPSPRERDLPRMVAASRGVSGTSHPAVVALFPSGGAGPLPRVAAGPRGARILELSAGEFSIGMAVAGKGRLEGVEP